MTSNQEEVLGAYDEGVDEGRESLAHMVLQLIWNSNYEVTLDEIEEFLVTQIGAAYDDLTP